MFKWVVEIYQKLKIYVALANGHLKPATYIHL